MNLRGINFGYVWGASGLQNFYGQGWPTHKYLKLLGLDFTGITFVAKTATIEERLAPEKQLGNMRMRADGVTPAELLPDCIYVTPRTWLQGSALNSVGLSGPGAKALLDNSGKFPAWQERTEPFVISFMSTAKNEKERLEQLRQFVELLKKHLPRFRAPVALQINFSCPNVGLNHVDQKFVNEMLQSLTIAQELAIPLIPKFSIVASIYDVAEICKHPACDAICISNTVPFGLFPEAIPWKKIFGSSTESPLKRYGGGGYSGKYLLPLTAKWISDFRGLGIKTPINAGGGILGPGDVLPLINAGADSIFLGSISFLRPWRVRATTEKANYLFRQPRQ